MLLWTDGEAALVATGRGVARVGGSGDELVRFDDEHATRREEPAALEFLAVLDGGARALFGRGGTLYEWIAGEGVRERGPAPRNAVALDGGRVLAAVSEPHADGRARTALALVSLARRGELSQERVLAVPEMARARGELAPWPRERLPWPEEHTDGFDPRFLDVQDRGGAWRGEVRLHANRHGVIATSSYSGAVIALDPRSLAPLWAFRLPVQPAATTAIHAVALDGGALIVVCVDGKAAAVMRAGKDGVIGAHRVKLGRDATAGLRAPLLVDDETAVVTNAMSTPQVHELGLAELSAKRVTTSPFGGEVGLLAHASTTDGTSHLVAIGDPDAPPHRWSLHRLVRSGGKLRATPLAMPDFRPPERMTPQGPARHNGPPSVGITAGSGVWTCAPGAEVDLTLSVTSKGGPAPGLWIELSGPAIDARLFDALAAVAGDVSAAFERRGTVLRAELAGPPLEPAYVRATGGPRVAKGEMPDPVSTVAIRVRGLKAGDALLMVRIGPTGSDGTGGSAMQGRSIHVASLS
jgi:hypothetical protein